MDLDPDSFVLPDMKGSQDNMLRRIFGKDYRQKVLAHLNLEIGENLKFGIGLYNFTRLVLRNIIIRTQFKTLLTLQGKQRSQNRTI